MKVLVVEDAVYIRDRLVEQLSAIPMTEVVGETGDYYEALELISNQLPDILILDIRLKNGNGIDILKSIKDIHPEAVTIILTNYPLPQYRRTCMNLGAGYFLDKSSDFERLPGIVMALSSDNHQSESDENG